MKTRIFVKLGDKYEVKGFYDQDHALPGMFKLPLNMIDSERFPDGIINVILNDSFNNEVISVGNSSLYGDDWKSCHITVSFKLNEEIKGVKNSLNEYDPITLSEYMVVYYNRVPTKFMDKAREEFDSLGVIDQRNVYSYPVLEAVKNLPGDGNWHEESVSEHIDNTYIRMLDIHKYLLKLNSSYDSDSIEFLNNIAFLHDIGKLVTDAPYYKDHDSKGVDKLKDFLSPTHPLFDHISWYIRYHHFGLSAIKVSNKEAKKLLYNGLRLSASGTGGICNPVWLLILAIADLVGTTSEKNREKREKMIDQLEKEIEWVESNIEW